MGKPQFGTPPPLSLLTTKRKNQTQPLRNWRQGRRASRGSLLLLSQEELDSPLNQMVATKLDVSSDPDERKATRAPTSGSLIEGYGGCGFVPSPRLVTGTNGD
jgi:hypothetical protein